MSHPKILIQLDADKHASVFDAVVAVDSDVDHLLQYSHVERADIEEMVHGSIFTRGPGDLKRTAIFIGGKDVGRAESLLDQVTSTFFGPMRVSVMMDANGANTTAAAAVVAANRHLDLSSISATVLAGTGPVGQRVALLLADAGADVRLVSRSMDRAKQVCENVVERLGDGPAGSLTPTLVDTPDDTPAAIDGCQLVIAAGAAGIQLLDAASRKAASKLKVAIDLNAVPPLGIEGTDVMDKAKDHDGVVCYGAIGVGGTKMKIHREAIRRLFSTNDLVLDAKEIFQIGRELDGSQ